MSYASYLEKLLERHQGIVARIDKLELVVKRNMVLEKASATLAS